MLFNIHKPHSPHIKHLLQTASACALMVTSCIAYAAVSHDVIFQALPLCFSYWQYRWEWPETTVNNNEIEVWFLSIIRTERETLAFTGPTLKLKAASILILSKLLILVSTDRQTAGKLHTRRRLFGLETKALATGWL